MKFCVCGCLFDYYVYAVSSESTFSLSRDIYKKKMLDILLLYAQLTVLSMLVMPVFLLWLKLKDLTKIFWMEFYVRTVIVGYLTRISQECKTQPERLFGIWKSISPAIIIMWIMQCVFVVLNVLNNLSAIFYMMIFIL